MTQLPVLVARCGEPEEIVTHKKTGWIVDAGHPELSTSEILRLLDNTGLSNGLAVSGHAHVLSCFSLSAMLDAYEEVYHAVL